MFLESLVISEKSKIIREIKFRKGINLIIDESSRQVTGNNVGKTTVLKLVDFCFGASKDIIWKDPESERQDYDLVKNYLIENKILITLELVSDLSNSDPEKLTIERNFLPRTKAIYRINGVDYKAKEFEPKLKELVFPSHNSEKPTFRQIISHNIRYKDLSVNNTLKTLDKFSTNVEYEALYLFLLGCSFEHSEEKQKVIDKLRQEKSYKKKLEKKQTKSAYTAALYLVEEQIKKLNEKKLKLSINENFEQDLTSLQEVKYDINKFSSNLNKLNIKKSLILEAESNLQDDTFDKDLDQLELIYQQATSKVTAIQKSFEELVEYHNKMVQEKIRFIKKGLPAIEQKIKEEEIELKKVLSREKELTAIISKGDYSKELEKIIVLSNEQHAKKGEYETVIKQIEEVEEEIAKLNQKLVKIEGKIFTKEYNHKIQQQINKFNKHFSAISQKLYGEQYAIKCEQTINKNDQKLYKFSAFNTNFSSGKKQGEISCFDIAYIQFADEEKIPTFHFLLNDKKELMHDNQLVKIAELVNGYGIQFVASILKDKLPEALNKEEYFILKLSLDDKLFRIENV